MKFKIRGLNISKMIFIKLLLQRWKMLSQKHVFLFSLLVLFEFASANDNKPLRVLNFYGSNGFQHDSKVAGIQMVEDICLRNNWSVFSTQDPGVFTKSKMEKFDVVVFNNNCGNNGRILSTKQQNAFQSFIRKGGGFVAIHCAGAIWNETGEFQEWYEKLVGTKLIAHPAVQSATCLVENLSHPATAHLQKIWQLKDEFHTMQPNPRDLVTVLVSVDERSYEGKEKMNGDHPLVWYHTFDGGRVFFSSLGHTNEMYANPDYKKMIEGGMKWSAGIAYGQADNPFIREGLIIDLNADSGVVINNENRVEKWINQAASFPVKEFVKKDEGRQEKGSGRPLLKKNMVQLNGHNTIAFKKQELVASDEDAFDQLVTGGGYTWLCVLKAGKQLGELKDVNAVFGTLKNGGYYEGLWAGLNDDNTIWAGSRNGKSFGRWDSNNPYVMSDKILNSDQYYLLIGCMDAGTDTVTISLYLNDGEVPVATHPFPVNVNANSSKLVIGQERDAIEHPGRESFVGEIARFLLYERALRHEELRTMVNRVMNDYGIEKSIN